MSAPRFRLEAELGSGATGSVARGVLLEPAGGWPAGTAVAVKYLHPELTDDAGARERFENEARVGSAVDHPGVVRVLGTGSDARGRFLVMPFVAGETLRAVLAREGALPEPLVRSVGRTLSGGLAALHAAGFVHGDVKPANIRLDAAGDAVLIDLGFAHAAQRAEGERTEPRPGSLPYVSPEQARGGAAGPAGDVFALGIVLYELATGVHPFAAQAAHVRGTRPHALLERSGSSGELARVALEALGADRLLAAIATARFVPPSRHAPQVSPFLDNLLRDVLQRDPARRPDAAELHRRLVEQEGGTWWRSEVDFAAGVRRGGPSEGDTVHLVPLVGRTRELDALLAAWSTSAAVPGSVWIHGPDGAGKSRLVAEFAARVRASGRPPLVLYGRARALDEDRPCRPVLRMLERYLRLPPAVAPAERDLVELAQLVPPSTAAALARALDPAGGAQEQISLPVALGEWLAALARRGPLVVHLDDANWAGESTLEVFARAAEALHAAPPRHGGGVLLVFGQRDGAEDRAPGAAPALRARLVELGLGTDTLRLEPLGPDAMQELVDRTFHHSAPRLRLAEVLLQKSRGSPGLVAEILRGMLVRGEAAPHPDGSGLVLSIEPDALPLPKSLRQAITDAYRRLAPADRAWLRRLAVVGGRIETAFLRRAFPEARDVDLDALLARLAREGWLASSGARYRFARPALREAVYRALSREQRTRLHGAAAAALAPGPGAPETLDDAFQRAFHLRAAGEDEALLEAMPGLLARLLQSGQPRRVHPLARWGLETLDRRPPSTERERLRIVLLEAVADATDRLGMREDQRDALDRLSESTFDAETDPLSAGRVYLLHARHATSTGRYGLARGLLRNAVELCERAGAGRELAEALRRLALVQAHVGELDEARELGERSLAAAATDAQRVLAHLALGIVDVLEDRVEPAMQRADDAIDLLRDSAAGVRPGLFAAAHLLRARVYRCAGEPGRALASAARAMRLAHVAGERRLEAEAMVRMGQLLLDVDRLKDAEARLREAVRLSEEIEDRRGEALARTFLGILLWEMGDPSASAMLSAASALADEMGLNRISALVAAVHARIALLERNDHAAALDWSAHALELLRRYGAEIADRIVIQGTRALVLETAGLPDEARALDRDLEEKLARDNARVRSPLLRLRQSRVGQRLVAAVRSPEGPLYPRGTAEGAPAAV